jgi:hypothetical protein
VPVTISSVRRQAGSALLVLLFAVSIDASGVFAQETAKPAKMHVTIVGRVVAKVWDLQAKPPLGNFTVFVISVESISNGKLSEKFVRIDYEYTSLKDRLPESFFDYSIRYRFEVVPDGDEIVTDIRDPEASTIGGLAAEIQPAFGAPEATWDHHRPLKIFVLRPRHYKAERQR